MRLRARLSTRTLAAAFGLVVAVASTALPTYLWCAGSGEVHLSCCCPGLDADADYVRAPCCEARSNASMDGAQASQAPRVGLAASAVIVALLETHDAAPSARARVERDALARAGPIERLHAQHSVYLL